MISRLWLLLLLLSGACAKTPEPLPPVVRATVRIADDLALGAFAISADGRWLAYSAETSADRRRRIHVQDLRAVTAPARELVATIGGTTPFFSPDGASIAYFAGNAIWRTAVEGAVAPVKVTEAPVESAGGAWTEDGRIVFSPFGGKGLVEVPAIGGAAAALTLLESGEGELEHGWPHVLPGGAIAFTVSQRGRDPHLEVLSADRKRVRLRVPIFGQSHFLRPGYLVYGYLGNVMAVRFDTEALEIRGAPTMVARGLQTGGGFGALGRAGLAASQSGTLVWLRASSADARSRLVRVDRDGRYEVLPVPAEVYQTPRLSPNGRRLAVVVRPDVMTREIRVLDVARPDRVIFSIRGGDNQSPAWMDDRRLTFGSNRDGPQKIYSVSAGGVPTPLFTADVAAARNPAAWRRSPRLLALYEIDPMRRRDVLVYRVGESVAPVAATSANERSPSLSPDGRWVAYVSDASGRDEIYIKPLDGSMETLQMTSSGAAEPVWTRDGLYYREGERMMLVSLESGAPGALREVFEGYFEHDPGANLAAYDVDANGRFIMLKAALAPRALRVVRNWTTELGWVGQ